MNFQTRSELLAVYPVTDVCRWLGHSPIIAARFYAQSQSEVSDLAASKLTVGSVESEDQKVGSKMGPVGVHFGSQTGPLSMLARTS
jgi:hypothetical protein